MKKLLLSCLVVVAFALAAPTESSAMAVDAGGGCSDCYSFYQSELARIDAEYLTCRQSHGWMYCAAIWEYAEAAVEAGVTLCILLDCPYFNGQTKDVELPPWATEPKQPLKVKPLQRLLERPIRA